MWSMNFQMFKMDLEKAEEPEIKFPTSEGSLKKQESSRKHLLLLYWLCQSLWLWITTNCGKFWKGWEYQTTWLTSWEMYASQEAKVRTIYGTKLVPNHIWNKTGSKLGKEYVKAVYCHPAYSASVQSTSCEMPGWLKTNKSRLLKEISTTSDMQITPP